MIQQAKDASHISQPSSSGNAVVNRDQPKDFLKDSDKQLNKAAVADNKKEVPKMMAAKKESEISSISAPQNDKQKKNEKSDDSLPGKKFQNIPDDAMKKQKLGGFADREEGRISSARYRRSRS